VGERVIIFGEDYPGRRKGRGIREYLERQVFPSLYSGKEKKVLTLVALVGRGIHAKSR